MSTCSRSAESWPHLGSLDSATSVSISTARSSSTWPRHAAGDWGELDSEDQAANGWAVVFGDERLLSAYRLADTTRIWVITEADRSATTVLLPEEY